MTSNKKDPVLVVLQMTGAYDALNTFVPYSDPHYVDYRANLQIGPDQVLAVDDKVGFHPGMDQIKDMYDQGKVAVLQGIGYPNRAISTARISLTSSAGSRPPPGSYPAISMTFL